MDRRAELLTLHARLCTALEGAQPREVASLVREMRAVLAELDAMPADEVVSAVDEVALAREARRKQAAAGGS